MKALQFRRSSVGIIAVAMSMALSGSVTYAADPVCAVSRDVASVLGRGGGSAPSVHCLVEAKVNASATMQDVSSIQGRGHAVSDRLAPSAIMVQSRELMHAPVQQILGRSSRGVDAQWRPQDDAVAESKAN